MSMKQLLLFSLLVTAHVRAQLPTGSMAPDFTLNAYQPGLSTAGLNADGTYRLYDYLDAGYTVYAEFTSTLCVPCWNFHQNGVLEDLYRHHGPLLPDHPGVDPASTNDVMVVWIDAQAGTPDSWLVDGGPFVNGNWINPTGNGEVPYPMCNPENAQANQLMQDYMVPFYPTVYRICPNRTVESVWSVDPEVLYAEASSCPEPSGAHNASLLSWKESDSCPLVENVVTLQNMGTDALTEAQIVFRKGTDVLQTINWNGDLATYQTEDINLGTLDPELSEDYTAEIVTPDDNMADNVLEKTIGPTKVAAGFTVTIEITTDAFGNETRWELQNLVTDNVIVMAGPFSMVQPPATVPQPVMEVELEAGQCYIFDIHDADGMNNGAGNGSYVLRDEAGDVIAQGGTFTGYASERFFVNGSAGNAEAQIAQLELYPNPAHGTLNVSFAGDGSDHTITACDLYGRVLYTATIGNASDMQALTIPTAGWKAGSYLVSVKKAGGMKTVNVMVE